MNGPYVVTVRRDNEVVSRRAVIDEHALSVHLCCDWLRECYDDGVLSIANLRATGSPGRIPLPDGAVIEVARVDWRELESIDRLFDGRPLIDWWNATHGVVQEA